MKLKHTLVLAAALGFTSGAHAAIIVSGSGNNTGFSVSSTDLLQTQLESTNDQLSINTGENNAWSGGATVGSLTDGNFLTSPEASTGSLVISGGSVTYTFNTTTNTFGYDLSQIGIFSGWRDNGRDGIDITISYATVSAPTTFQELARAVQDDVDSQFEHANITENSAPFLAIGVKSIRFTFNSPENGGAGYKELDVVGVATVPEPSAALLGGLGLLALIRRRR